MNPVKTRIGGSRPGLRSILPVALALVWTGIDRAQEVPPYRDPSLPASQRAHDLLSRMNLNEKVGQMTLIYLTFLTQDQDVATYNLGSIFGGETFPPNVPLIWARQYNRLQKVAVEGTRLGIPLLWGTDGVHGNGLLLGAVIFPHHIGLGTTWNPALVEKFAQVAAVELRATGRRWTFAPTLDVARHDHWGRTFETFSEDPYVSGVMGAHEVNGYQGSDLAAPGSVLACGKHYLCSGGTVDGLDAGSCFEPMRIVREVHLDPFIFAVKGGLYSVMATYASLNGVKVHGSANLLTSLLKVEQGFEGFIVTDWAGINQVDPDYPTAVERCINAGIDMSLVPDDYPRFQQVMKNHLASGRISMSRLDDAVYRILLAKFRLGLFDDPYVEEDATWVVGSAAHRKVARQAVRESVVLLKNDTILPLSKSSSIFVTGPNADNIIRQCGGWTVGWQRAAFPPPGTTILQAIRNSAMGRVTYSADGSGAAGNDVAVVVVGEEPYAERLGDTDDLDLPQDQLALVDKVVGSGTPTVVIMVTGRPRTGIEKRLSAWRAFLVAWLPGTEGQGVADVLFGDFDATGRLSHSWPRRDDQEPINYDHASGGAYEPLFEFGYGLSYTTFSYKNLTVIPSPNITVNDRIEVSVEVENIGQRAGSEVVQVYVTEVTSGSPAPFKKLYRFKKLEIEKGGVERVGFTLPAAELGYSSGGPEKTLEPGFIRVMVGRTMADLEVTTGGTTLPPLETFTAAAREPVRLPPPSVLPGSGTGLTGEYYTSAEPVLFNSLKKKVVDPRLDFDPFTDKLKKETGQGEHCAVRWTGWVEARHSESYTFYARTDDGVRLWIDGKLLIDLWMDRAAGEDYNNLALLAGRRYPITMEYYQGWGAAVAQLSWSSLSTPKEIIPRTQLYSDRIPQVWFRRGDSNSDAMVDVSDVVHTINYLFLAGNPSKCPDAADADDSSEVDISDPVYTIQFLFLAGTSPPAPGPRFCGGDPTEDSLPQCLRGIEDCD